MGYAGSPGLKTARDWARDGYQGLPLAGENLLADYANGVFGRISEAAFFDPTDGAGFVEATEAANWLANNVWRLYSSGNILLESARTNEVIYSADMSSWTMASGTGTETAGQTAPDASTSAYRIEDTDAGSTTRWYESLITLSALPYVACVLILKDNDTSRFPEFQITQIGAVITGGTIGVQLNTSTGATSTRIGSPTTVRVTSAGDWWYLEIGFICTTGGTVRPTIYPAVTASIGTVDVAATGAITPWGVQIETTGAVGVVGSQTSPIRTAGVIATRAQETLYVPQADVDVALYDVGFEIDIWPNHDSGTAGHTVSYICNTVASSRNYLRLNPQNATDTRMWYRSATSGALQSANFTFVKGDKLTVRVEHQVLMTILKNDAPLLTLSLAAAADNWVHADLYVGGSASGTLFVDSMIISPPRPLP